MLIKSGQQTLNVVTDTQKNSLDTWRQMASSGVFSSPAKWALEYILNLKKNISSAVMSNSKWKWNIAAPSLYCNLVLGITFYIYIYLSQIELSPM